MSPDDYVTSSGIPVVESSYSELEDDRAKIHLVDSSRTIFRFSMHGTCMRSTNELVVYTMLVVQPTSRVHNPMAVPSKMMGDVGT